MDQLTPTRFETSVGPLTAEQIGDHLEFASYRAQRDIWGMTAEQAARIFPRAAEHEARFQRQVNAYATAKVFCSVCNKPGVVGFCAQCEAAR